MQLCAGQEAGCEAAMHAMGEIFREEETNALLFVDATNAFNSLNRNTMIHNIQYLCPQWLYAYNSYCTPARLFIQGGEEITSLEGTNQGDPLAMPLRRLSTYRKFSTDRNGTENFPRTGTENFLWLISTFFFWRFISNQKVNKDGQMKHNNKKIVHETTNVILDVLMQEYLPCPATESMNGKTFRRNSKVSGSLITV